MRELWQLAVEKGKAEGQETSQSSALVGRLLRLELLYGGGHCSKRPESGETSRTVAPPLDWFAYRNLPETNH